MDLNTLKSNVAEALANSAAIKAWAQATYGRDHRVYKDVNTRQWPGEDACPYVVVSAVSKNIDRGRPQRDHGLGFVFYVYDDSEPTQVYANLYEYNGGDRVEAFRKLAQDVVAGLLTDEELFVDVEEDPLSEFPYAMAVMFCGIREQVTIGNDPID
jgi:hypothetical protein